MKKTLKLLMAVVALGIAAIGFGGVDETITVTRQSPTFSIRLPSNPTTGYSWAIASYETRWLTMLPHQYVPSSPQLIGSGGYEIWSFQARPEAFQTKECTTDIKMVYARPWETAKGLPVASVHTIQVNFQK